MQISQPRSHGLPPVKQAGAVTVRQSLFRHSTSSGPLQYSLQARRCGSRALPIAGSQGPKAGLVGPNRFQDGALPGTYHGSSATLDGADRVTVNFQTDANLPLSIEVPVGSNLLRAAEQAGALNLNRDFCFEGTCELCQLEVVGGAKELGSKAQPGSQELVRSCISAVPASPGGAVHVKILSDESVWAEGVL